MKDYYILSIPHDSAYGIYDTLQQALEEGSKPENQWLGLVLFKSKMNRAFYMDDCIGHFRKGEFIKYKEEN